MRIPALSRFVGRNELIKKYKTEKPKRELFRLKRRFQNNFITISKHTMVRKTLPLKNQGNKAYWEPFRKIGIVSEKMSVRPLILFNL